MGYRVPMLVGFLLASAALLAGGHDESEIARVHADDSPQPTEAALTEPAVEVVSRVVSYAQIDGQAVEGYLAQPADVDGPLPALIVIHEWWGLNDNIRRLAERLAGEGYTALAVDLYRGEVASAPKEAMGLMQALGASPEFADSNLRQAFAYLETEHAAPRIGSIGWCLGGRYSLRTGLVLPDTLDALVIYYGSLVTDEAELATLEMPILGNFAENDPIIPQDTLDTFTETLARLGKDADIKVFPNTKHAFSNPSGMAYEPEAAAEAWARSTEFLRTHLQ